MRWRRSSGIGNQPRGFLVELALQVLGIGRDPHRRIVAPRPEPGGRQIAQRLAEARAGLGQQDVVHRPCAGAARRRRWRRRHSPSAPGAARIRAPGSRRERPAPRAGATASWRPGGRPPSSSHSSMRSQTLRPVAKVPTSSFGLAFSSAAHRRAWPMASWRGRGRWRSPPSRGSADNAGWPGAAEGRRQ